jgi:hypothetical protein
MMEKTLGIVPNRGEREGGRWSGYTVTARGVLVNDTVLYLGFEEVRKTYRTEGVCRVTHTATLGHV